MYILYGDAMVAYREYVTYTHEQNFLRWASANSHSLRCGFSQDRPAAPAGLLRVFWVGHSTLARFIQYTHGALFYVIYTAACSGLRCQFPDCMFPQAHSVRAHARPSLILSSGFRKSFSLHNISFKHGPLSVGFIFRKQSLIMYTLKKTTHHTHILVCLNIHV